MGKKVRYTESQDQYLRDNYLLKPVIHIAKHLDIHYKAIYRRFGELGLVVPEDIKERFKRTHRGINEPSPVQKKYYTSKKKELRQPDKIKAVKKEDRVLKTKVVDYSTKYLFKIDHKTWVYRDK